MSSLRSATLLPTTSRCERVREATAGVDHLSVTTPCSSTSDDSTTSLSTRRRVGSAQGLRFGAGPWRPPSASRVSSSRPGIVRPSASAASCGRGPSDGAASIDQRVEVSSVTMPALGELVPGAFMMINFVAFTESAEDGVELLRRIDGSDAVLDRALVRVVAEPSSIEAMYDDFDHVYVKG